MSTVDEILAAGKYTDRRGREWKRGPSFVCNRDWFYRIGIYKAGYANDAEMRLLIERDQHRDECRGVRECQYHPVPRVFEYRGQFGRWSVLAAGADGASDTARNDLTAAMDAARALAVGE